MSNGLFSGTLRTLRDRSAVCALRTLQTRHKSGKKFFVPPSFQTHLKANHSRQKAQHDKSQSSQTTGLRKLMTEESQAVPDDVTQQVLDNNVELAVTSAAGREFGIATGPIIEQFCGQPHHPHIAASMKGYVSRDYMDLGAASRLWLAIHRFLPEDPLNRVFITSPRGKMMHASYTHASQASKSHVGRIPSPQRQGLSVTHNCMNMGWHLVLFTTPIFGQSLLFDGTDDRFIPGPPGIWKYRLWASGSIKLHKMFPPNLENQQLVHQVESPVDFRIVGADKTPEKLFVTIRKRFFEVERYMLQKKYNEVGLIDFLKSEPAYGPQGSLSVGPKFEETYTLCFLRQPPNLSAKAIASRVIAPPLQPKFSHSLTPDRHLLFCWSALTYNAHRIHLDQQFAQKEYGAKDLLVHGPLTLLLVLEWFQREITRYVLDRQLSRFHLESIDYKVLMPMYVDESMTLCTKPSKFQTPGTLASSWEVWIQKEVGDGINTMTFKGTIKVKVEDDLELPNQNTKARQENAR